jgi:NTE family protein
MVAAMRRGLVLGCGGTVGGAWTVGALAAVSRALRWDPREADVIVGTSAGATIAAMLGAGVGVDELLAAHRGESGARASVRRFCTEPPAALPRVPLGLPAAPRLVPAGLRRKLPLLALSGLAPPGRTDPSFLDALSDDLAPAGWVAHPATWLVAVDTTSGDRVAFGAPEMPAVALRDAIRASWAIPGWYPPVAINGRRFLDGGAASTASVDLLAPHRLDEVVLIAPMAGERGGRLEWLLRRLMTRRLEHEVTAVEAAGTRVLRIHPNVAELAVMGPNFMHPARRLPALDTALTRLGAST